MLIGLRVIAKSKWWVSTTGSRVLDDSATVSVCSSELRRAAGVVCGIGDAASRALEIIDTRLRFKGAISGNSLPVSLGTVLPLVWGISSDSLAEEVRSGGSRWRLWLLGACLLLHVHWYFDVIVDLLGGLNCARIVERWSPMHLLARHILAVDVTTPNGVAAGSGVVEGSAYLTLPGGIEESRVHATVVLERVTISAAGRGRVMLLLFVSVSGWLLAWVLGRGCGEWPSLIPEFLLSLLTRDVMIVLISILVQFNGVEAG